jgi:cytochrome c biogenesis protein CcmG, thiol:disulfide interchange protein DsbE
MLLLVLAPAAPAKAKAKWQGPTFKLEALDGTKLTQTDVFVDGKVYLVDFWGSFCKPCNALLPHLNDMVTDYGDRGFQVVLFSEDDAGGVSTARTMLAGKDYPFTVLFDTEGDVKTQLAAKGMPTTILLDSKGNELWRHNGYKAGNEDLIREKIEEYLPAE